MPHDNTFRLAIRMGFQGSLLGGHFPPGGPEWEPFNPFFREAANCVRRAAISPDGEWACTASFDKIHVWRTSSLEAGPAYSIEERDDQAVLDGEWAPVFSVSGFWLTCLVDTGRPRVVLLRLQGETVEEPARFEGRAAAFVGDPEQLAILKADGRDITFHDLSREGFPAVDTIRSMEEVQLLLPAPGGGLTLLTRRPARAGWAAPVGAGLEAWQRIDQEWRLVWSGSIAPPHDPRLAARSAFSHPRVESVVLGLSSMLDHCGLSREVIPALLSTAPIEDPPMATAVLASRPPWAVLSGVMDSEYRTLVFGPDAGTQGPLTLPRAVTAAAIAQSSDRAVLGFPQGDVWLISLDPMREGPPRSPFEARIGEDRILWHTSGTDAPPSHVLRLRLEGTRSSAGVRVNRVTVWNSGSGPAQSLKATLDLQPIFFGAIPSGGRVVRNVSLDVPTFGDEVQLGERIALFDHRGAVTLSEVEVQIGP